MSPISPETLASLNPDMQGSPSGFVYGKALKRVSNLVRQLEKCPGVQSADLNDQIQDSAHFAEIRLKPWESSLRFSSFADLVTMTREERLPPDVLRGILETLEAAGFHYVPFALFGNPFDLLDRGNGDLFNQLFDYL